MRILIGVLVINVGIGVGILAQMAGIVEPVFFWALGALSMGLAWAIALSE